ncbi:hypothetical protein SDC9_122088 [bioreactor metagenome]|uniref:Dinitrogenase iron-molybdenum cofactor biosynthesis domain-containing protein n=1 Tax=bioreactor metagenome TaxID=1076179 RepID=A0A645CDR8_9ZZZZ
MKIAVTTAGNSPDDALESRFGRAPRFLLIDTDTGAFKLIDNVRNLNAAQGAGIQAAMTAADAGAEAVITGHCGPKAFRVLREAGIQVFHAGAVSVREALELHRQGKLEAAEAADVEGHWL